jgi:FKBP-type peptidyl-prolyl cis-trans isomerase SlyD
LVVVTFILYHDSSNLPQLYVPLQKNLKIIEEVNETQPFVFLFGAGNIIPGFEQNVNKLKVGDNFAFSVKSQEAYGEYDEHGVAEIPITVFQNEGIIDEEICKVGNIVPLQNEQGHHFNGVIKAISDTNVTMDFNHPLAGVDLHFRGSVLDIREATAKEIEKGHIHRDTGEGHSCGCSC